MDANIIEKFLRNERIFGSSWFKFEFFTIEPNDNMSDGVPSP